ncbi:MAG: hypothetical protein A2Y13_07755 [Planctomycetes bacterium GWC2_45_44]|nr:MAG: hypothetical protein A2Y13_07755 [Planctomycetes bacterium GWC2_45_44]
MAKSDKIGIITQDNNSTGESPVWDPIKRRLIWVDIDNALVFQFLPLKKEKTIISHDLSVASVALNQDGRLIFAGNEGLYLWRGEDDYKKIVAEYDDELLCFNDMIAGPNGQIYAGTLYWGNNGMEKTGKLYIIRPDLSISVMEDNINLSNGLGFSCDGSKLYYTDSGRRCIFIYDVDCLTGDLKNRRIFIKIPSDEGIPDGLTVDIEGFIWSALWYGGQVVRYDPDGKVQRRIPVPAKQVSSVMLGGDDMMSLYITSASQYWPSSLVPCKFDLAAHMGGSLYMARVEVPGKSEYMADFKV